VLETFFGVHYVEWLAYVFCLILFILSIPVIGFIAEAWYLWVQDKTLKYFPHTPNWGVIFIAKFIGSRPIEIAPEKYEDLESGLYVPEGATYTIHNNRVKDWPSYPGGVVVVGSVAYVAIISHILYLLCISKIVFIVFTITAILSVLTRSVLRYKRHKQKVV